MQTIHYLIVSVGLLVSLSSTSCLSNICDSTRQKTTITTAPISDNSNLTIGKQATDISIRKVDFRNFTYPLTFKLFSDFFPIKSATLINGHSSPSTTSKTSEIVEPSLSLASITYDNVNGNPNDEEAIIDLSIESGGSSMEHCIYIYGIRHGATELLWKFDTGDRSHGGLRKVYGDRGQLIVETYNNDVWYPDNEPVQPGPACCATSYTLARYEWTGLRYQLVEAKRLNNPGRSASTEMSSSSR